jgi:hypothetical protein
MRVGCLSPRLPVTVNDLAITLFIVDLTLAIGSDLRRAHAATAAATTSDQQTHPSRRP